MKPLAENEGYAEGTLGHGTHKGQGVTFREMGPKNEPTDKYLQWHPGGGRHGPDPYWKISSGPTGTIRIGPQFPPYVPPGE